MKKKRGLVISNMDEGVLHAAWEGAAGASLPPEDALFILLPEKRGDGYACSRFAGSGNITGAVVCTYPYPCTSSMDVSTYVKSLSGTVPAVSCGTLVEGVPSVFPDVYSGAYRMVERLVKKEGRMRVAFVSGEDGISSSRSAYKAYLDAQRANGLPEGAKAVLSPFSLRGKGCGRTQLPDSFDALFCTSPLTAAAALLCLEENGNAGDVAVSYLTVKSLPDDPRALYIPLSSAVSESLLTLFAMEENPDGLYPDITLPCTLSPLREDTEETTGCFSYDFSTLSHPGMEKYRSRMSPPSVFDAFRGRELDSVLYSFASSVSGTLSWEDLSLVMERFLPLLGVESAHIFVPGGKGRTRAVSGFPFVAAGEFPEEMIYPEEMEKLYGSGISVVLPLLPFPSYLVAGCLSCPERLEGIAAILSTAVTGILQREREKEMEWREREMEAKWRRKEDLSDEIVKETAPAVLFSGTLPPSIMETGSFMEIQDISSIPRHVSPLLFIVAEDGAISLDDIRRERRFQSTPVIVLKKRITMEDAGKFSRFCCVLLLDEASLGSEKVKARITGIANGDGMLPLPAARTVMAAMAALTRDSGSPVERRGIASSLALSEDYLTRIFRRSLGITPWEYLKLKRLERADELLTGTDLPLGEIARLSGFSSQAYFSSVYRDARGLPPGAARKLGAGI